MSVTNKAYVANYASDHAACLNALHNLSQFVTDLPAPNDAGELPTMHPEDLAMVKVLRYYIGEAAAVADKMFK